ncbi:MAG TPA: PASTA domain-containing protein [Candidatus Limnocylindrales bacterium]
MGDERRDLDETTGSSETSQPQDAAERLTPEDLNPPQDATERLTPDDLAPPQDETPQDGTPQDATERLAPEDLQDVTEPFAPEELPVPQDATERLTPEDLPAPQDATERLTPEDLIRPMAPPDATERFTPVGGADETSVIPQSGAWSGRAGVPAPQSSGRLRDSAPYTQQIPQPGQQRPWWTPVLLGLVAVGLLGALILAAYWMNRENPAPVESPAPSAVVVPSPTPEATTAPPTTQPATPTAPQAVPVPRLVGLTQDQATTQLDQLGLAYRFEYRQAPAPEGTVVESRPGQGEMVPLQTTVTLVISTGQDPEPTPTPTPTPTASAAPGN